MDFPREVLRGSLAAPAAFALMGALATGAVLLLDVPVSWPLVAAVLAAATGAPASLTGTAGSGPVGAVVHGAVDVIPLGVALPGAVVFAVLLLGGSLRTPLRVLAARAAGAAATLTAVLVVVLVAGPATVPVSLPSGAGRPGEIPGGSGTPGVLLAVQPGVGVTILGALVGFVILTGGCAALTRLPHRRIVARVTLLGILAPVAAGLALSALVAVRWPGLAGAGLLYGPNAVLAGITGTPQFTVAGRPVGDDGGGTELLVVRLMMLVVIVLACAALLIGVPPGKGGRWQRARGIAAGAAFAAVLTGLSVLSAGSLELGVTVLMFTVPVLALQLPPAVGWAALGGGLAGFVGSLLADVRARRGDLPAAPAGREPRAVPAHGESERG
jgi:hypothetical protein